MKNKIQLQHTQSKRRRRHGESVCVLRQIRERRKHTNVFQLSNYNSKYKKKKKKRAEYASKQFTGRERRYTTQTKFSSIDRSRGLRQYDTVWHGGTGCVTECDAWDGGSDDTAQWGGGSDDDEILSFSLLYMALLSNFVRLGVERVARTLALSHSIYIVIGWHSLANGTTTTTTTTLSLSLYCYLLNCYSTVNFASSACEDNIDLQWFSLVVEGGGSGSVWNRYTRVRQRERERNNGMRWASHPFCHEPTTWDARPGISQLQPIFAQQLPSRKTTYYEDGRGGDWRERVRPPVG